MCGDYFGVVIGESQSQSQVRPVRGRCANCGYQINWGVNWLRFSMARLTIDRMPPGPKLDALTAEKVFGWQKVHKHQGALVGRKQDKAGRWRRAKVPNYSTNPLHSYSVENRMKQLGRMDRYEKELSKLIRSETFRPIELRRSNAAVLRSKLLDNMARLSR
jgi:hypothetical protein